MSVNAKHPGYADNVKRWKLVDVTEAGQDEVKEQGRELLPGALPLPPRSGNTGENGDQIIRFNDEEVDAARYAAYLLRAIYYNFVSRSIEGMAGLGMSGGTEFTAPKGLEYLGNDVDGAGTDLDQQTKGAVSGLIKYAHYGIIVDFPKTEGSLTKAQMDAQNVRATIQTYDPKNIINWRYERVGAEHKLSLVVLEEAIHEVKSDGFETEKVAQHRVLKLDEDGLYAVEIHKEGSDVPEMFEPLSADGKRLDHIPFYFLGAESNRGDVIDKSTMYDIAVLNIGHYRNSADYENTAWLIGQPQSWISGLDQNWVEEVLGSFEMGSGRTLPLPVGGVFGITQVQPNQMSYEAMKHKEEAMAALGAKMISVVARFNSATEAAINNTAESSRTQTIVDNTSDAYTQALKDAALFMGEDPDKVEYKIQTNLLSSIVSDPIMAKSIVDGWLAGLFAKADAREFFRKAGGISRDDVDIDLDLQTEKGIELD